MISVITPSLRQFSQLRLCIASVSDQGVDCEHIIQDGGSDDGTLDGLSGDSRVRLCVEKDAGMYDAINRGLQKSRGDLLAYLNCDEQYLPGTLKTIHDYFENNPEVDVVFGDIIVIDKEGSYLFHRKVQVPSLYHTWVVHLSTLSCAMFFRRRVIEKHGLFNTQFRAAGDAEWVLRLLKAGVRMAHLPLFTSAFTITGKNLSAGERASQEAEQLRSSAPLWAQKLKFSLILQHRFRRLAAGAYFQKSFEYAVFTTQNEKIRKCFLVNNPTFRWKM